MGRSTPPAVGARLGTWQRVRCVVAQWHPLPKRWLTGRLPIRWRSSKEAGSVGDGSSGSPSHWQPQPLWLCSSRAADRRTVGFRFCGTAQSRADRRPFSSRRAIASRVWNDLCGRPFRKSIATGYVSTRMTAHFYGVRRPPIRCWPPRPPPRSRLARPTSGWSRRKRSGNAGRLRIL